MKLEAYYHSDTADSKGINNIPDDETATRCILFLKYAVEPLELLFHFKGLVHHSGFRCLDLNTLLKGQKHSQHLVGNALDFHVEGFSLQETYTIIKNSGLAFDQLLLEGKGDHQWIHLSYNTDLPATKQRKQALELPNA